MHLQYIRDKSAKFQYEGDPLEVTSLKIWHCKYKSLSRLAEFRNLISLEIASFPDNSFDYISNLSLLERLSVLHLPKVTNIEPLANLKSLRQLILSTLPSWDASNKITKIESLIPLTKLPNLEAIELIGVVGDNGMLDNLKRCVKLRSAVFTKYPKESVNAFYEMAGVEKKRVV